MPYSRPKSGRPQKYLPGHNFGLLTLLDRRGNRGILACSCGNVIEVSMSALISGGKIDCGHVAAESDIENATKQSGDMLYWTWHNMLSRCEDPHNPAYKNYGALGVKVCGSWHNFETFKSDLGTRPLGMTLDRIDPTGNYEPQNCRWATIQEQATNKRTYQKDPT